MGTHTEDTSPRAAFGRERPADAEQLRQGLKSTLERVERDLISEALRLARGNKARAARALGITERLMGIRVKKLGIDWRALRTEWRLPPGAGSPSR